MSTLRQQPQQFEFSFPALDTLVLVEEDDAGVTIRATRDNFSDERKDAFLRELVQEGFISERHRWELSGEWSEARVRWQVDCSWVRLSEALLARPRRFMVKMLWSSVCLWVAMMSLLFISGHR